MTKKLIKHGNSIALIPDKVLVSQAEETLPCSLEKINQKHGAVLRKLGR